MKSLKAAIARADRLKGYVFSGSARTLSLLIQFVLIFTISNVIGLEAVGIFGPFVALALTAGIFMNKGQAARAFMEMPVLVHDRDLFAARLKATEALLTNATFAFLVAPVIAIVGFFYLGSVVSALIITVVAICFSLFETLAAILRSLDRIMWAELVRNALWRGLAIVVVVAMAFAGLKFEPMHIEMVLVSATLPVLLATILVLDLPSPRRIAPTRENKLTDWHNWAIQGLQAAMQNLDILLVPLIFGIREAAVYFIATRISAIVSLPLAVTNPVITPIYSRIARTGIDATLQARVRTNTIINVAASIVLAGLIAIGGQQIALAIAGETIDAWGLILMLSVGHIANTVVGPSMQVSQLFGIRSQSLVLQLSGAVLIIMAGVAGHMQNNVLIFAGGVALSRVLVNSGIAVLLHRIARINLFTGKPTV